MSEYEALLAKLEQQNLEQDRRLKNLEHTYKAISELTYVTKDLVEAVRKLTEIQQTHDNRLIALEHAQGDHLIKVKSTISLSLLSAACGAFTTWLITTLL